MSCGESACRPRSASLPANLACLPAALLAALLPCCPVGTLRSWRAQQPPAPLCCRLRVPRYIPDFREAFDHFCLHAGG